MLSFAITCPSAELSAQAYKSLTAIDNKIEGQLLDLAGYSPEPMFGNDILSLQWFEDGGACTIDGEFLPSDTILSARYGTTHLYDITVCSDRSGDAKTPMVTWPSRCVKL